MSGAGILRPRRLFAPGPPPRRAAIVGRPANFSDRTSAVAMNERYSELERLLWSEGSNARLDNGYKVTTTPGFASVCASPWTSDALCVDVSVNDAAVVNVVVAGGIAGAQAYTYELGGAVSARMAAFVAEHGEVQRLLMHAMPLFSKYAPEMAPLANGAINRILGGVG